MSNIHRLSWGIILKLTVYPKIMLMITKVLFRYKNKGTFIQYQELLNSALWTRQFSLHHQFKAKGICSFSCIGCLDCQVIVMNQSYDVAECIDPYYRLSNMVEISHWSSTNHHAIGRKGDLLQMVKANEKLRATILQYIIFETTISNSSGYLLS